MGNQSQSDRHSSHEVHSPSMHGRKQSLNLTEVNYRANIRAMKKLGVDLLWLYQGG